MRSFKLYLAALILLSVSVYSQQVTKVLVSGLGGSHDEGVKNSFLAGYASYDNTSFSGSVDLYYDASVNAQSSLEYASANGYTVIVRSTTGLSSVITEAKNYPDIQVFMPAGSNTFKKVYYGSVDDSPIVITGAGDTENTTGYSIEFFSIDPLSESMTSSYANGYIAGQVCYIANRLNISVSDARQLSRETGSNGGTYDTYDGYGNVVIENAVVALPVELNSFYYNLVAEGVELKWETATEVNNYGFEIERKVNDGADWENLGFVQGNGTVNTPQYYSFLDSDIPEVDTVSYRLKQIDLDGSYRYSKIVKIAVNSSTAVTGINDMDVPDKFSLSQNYPNPFNPTTNIEFSIANSENVILKVYDILGGEVATLVNGVHSSGKYSVEFNASKLVSGIYIYSLKAGNYSAVKKMMLVK